MLRADYNLGDETQKLVLQLHEWPGVLDEHVQKCEEKHDEERQALEKDLIKRRREFE